jgi:ABC-type lipoprotein release transport system permease subunit
VGVAAGLAIGLSTVDRLQAVLFGVQPRDPVTFAFAAGALAIVAWAAAYLPARRAARTDPAATLRAT